MPSDADFYESVCEDPLPEKSMGKGKHMATVFYIVDMENGEYPSEDGQVLYRALSGKKLYEYLSTEEGKKKVFDIEEYEDESKIGVEVYKGAVHETKKKRNRNEYMQRYKVRAGYQMISLDSKADEDDEESLSLSETVADPEVNVEEDALHDMMLQTLREARKCLTDEENMLLDYLYNDTDAKIMTHKEVGELMGISQQAVTQKKKKIFEKIRKYFEKTAC